ncbi:uncharacterized protein [Engystomops pustulosus]|uniref:uncharacterized protein n=1 Tax=Engystomops pustulosus TaxID=76066 RepID=UPI003AFA230A
MLSSTISRMKIIILFALAGLSLVQERSCYVTSGSKLTNAQCVEFTANNAPDFSVNLGILKCTLEGKIPQNEEKFRAATKELLLMLKSGGCDMSGILDIQKDQTLESALTAAGKTLEDVAPKLLKVFGSQISKNLKPLLELLEYAGCIVEVGDGTNRIWVKNPDPEHQNAVTINNVVQLLGSQISKNLKPLLELLEYAGCIVEVGDGTNRIWVKNPDPEHQNALPINDVVQLLGSQISKNLKPLLELLEYAGCIVEVGDGTNRIWVKNPDPEHQNALPINDVVQLLSNVSPMTDNLEASVSTGSQISISVKQLLALLEDAGCIVAVGDGTNRIWVKNPDPEHQNALPINDVVQLLKNIGCMKDDAANNDVAMGPWTWKVEE